MPTTFQERINQCRADGVAAYQAYVSEASGGLLTADYSEDHGIRLSRTDGGVLDTVEGFSGEFHDITGVFTGIRVWTKIDGRNKRALRELRNEIRRFVVKYMHDSYDVLALMAFEDKYRLGY